MLLLYQSLYPAVLLIATFIKVSFLKFASINMISLIKHKATENTNCLKVL
jgi:hypothetical protein